MPVPDSISSAIVCEIFAGPGERADTLAAIAAACASDIGQPLAVQTHEHREQSRRSRRRDRGPVLTLHLPAALAATQHQVWCLACRLACFCPSARISVLVHGETAFQSVVSAAAAQPPRRIA